MQYRHGHRPCTPLPPQANVTPRRPRQARAVKPAKQLAIPIGAMY